MDLPREDSVEAEVLVVMEKVEDGAPLLSLKTDSWKIISFLR
jgi:hypothetical protein